ncbi:MAG: nuclear transport factor 2 family protein [Streptosporangiaceae bacterium]
MDRAAATALLDRLHRAQNEFYAGGSADALDGLLAPGITWTVPGHSPLAGIYRGRAQVMGYFTMRRGLAADTFQIQRRDVLVGDGDRIAALTDGRATIAGAEHHWSTVGLYDVVGRYDAAGQQVAACWLLPLDPTAFDAIWTP